MIRKRNIRSKLVRPALALVLSVFIFTTLLLSSACAKNPSNNEETKASVEEPATSDSDETQADADERIKAFDFTLQDQFGEEHLLSDYEGKVIFLNFWATWCPPCKGELPDIEGLYRDNNRNTGALAVLGVIFPDEEGASSPSQREMNTEGIKQFLLEEDLTFPVLLDTEGKIFEKYRVTGLPTTFIIDREGYFIGYAPGALPRDLMDYYVKQAMEAGGDGE
ncbi:MAG TPA: TlpA disulfide reductase family protein [Clostridia bacterium]|nr:TlpA disulfide reductase family protein [Clostridia bacterium]